MENIDKEKSEKEIGLKENLAIKIKNFATKKPKQTYYIIVGLTIFSLLLTMINIVHTKNVVIPQYEKMNKAKIFETQEGYSPNPIQMTGEALEISELLKELEYYKSKPTLTQNDSLRVKYLIDKYKKNAKK